MKLAAHLRKSTEIAKEFRFFHHEDHVLLVASSDLWRRRDVTRVLGIDPDFQMCRLLLPPLRMHVASFPTFMYWKPFVKTGMASNATPLLTPDATGAYASAKERSRWLLCTALYFRRRKRRQKNRVPVSQSVSQSVVDFSSLAHARTQQATGNRQHRNQKRNESDTQRTAATNHIDAKDVGAANACAQERHHARSVSPDAGGRGGLAREAPRARVRHAQAAGAHSAAQQRRREREEIAEKRTPAACVHGLAVRESERQSRRRNTAHALALLAAWRR